ncbi:MAG: branched-chain amino acid ABC transporter permease [Longimicrobiales bacterium]|nr:branched-chain amino acid ABC transporter permease [Longimicrobiales bacterium]
MSASTPPVQVDRALSRRADPRALTARVLLAAGLVAPLILPGDYLRHIAVLCGIYVILTVSLNIPAGYLGLLHLGHAAFFGIGAYAAALLTVDVFHGSWPGFWIGLPAAGAMAALFGVLLGIPTMRVRGDYLAIVTLGFGEIVRFVLINWESVTRGPIGIPDIPLPALPGITFADKTAYYYLVLVFVLLTVLPVAAMRRGALGRAWIAIRDNEVAAEAMGVPTGLCKILGLAIAAFYAGIAGALYAHYVSYINPAGFSGWESITILTMLALGGRGTIVGAVVGAIVLTVVPELLRGLALYRQLAYGVLMVVLMVFRPRGLMGDRGV